MSSSMQEIVARFVCWALFPSSFHIDELFWKSSVALKEFSSFLTLSGSCCACCLCPVSSIGVKLVWMCSVGLLISRVKRSGVSFSVVMLSMLGKTVWHCSHSRHELIVSLGLLCDDEYLLWHLLFDLLYFSKMHQWTHFSIYSELTTQPQPYYSLRFVRVCWLTSP